MKIIVHATGMEMQRIVNDGCPEHWFTCLGEDEIRCIASGNCRDCFKSNGIEFIIEEGNKNENHPSEW